MMTNAEFQMLEMVAKGQCELSDRFGVLAKAFAVHCAVEEAAAKVKSNRVPLLATAAAIVSSAAAIAALFLSR